eukprot:g14596.t1
MRGSVFVATLCLLLTATVDGMSNKKKRKKSNDSVYERRRACQTGPCHHLVPLEAMNCVNECVSPDCYRKTYAEPLEDGEVNKQLSTNFLACARKEMNTSYRSKKRSERSSSRKPAAVASAGAATVDSDGAPPGEKRESPQLTDGGMSVKQNDGVTAESDDGDAEEEEWYEGFEESSDEGAGGLEGGAQQEANQAVAALRRELWASALQVGGCNHKLVEEVLMGERRFVADMHTLVEVFHWPLLRWFQQQQAAARAGEQSCPVSRADIDSVFSNVDELIAFSRRLLPALERARTARSKGLLVVFLQLATSFKVFDAYVAGWPKGMECLAKMEADPPLAMFIRACELQERCSGLRLRDLLAMPLQRVTQYRLLVESTSENCPLHLAALHRELARSLTLPPAMSGTVPSATAPLERRPYSERLHCSGPTKMIGKTAPRRLRGVGPSRQAVLPRPKIKEGRLTKVCGDGPRSVRFVLFSDELFHSSIEIATAANGGGGGGGGGNGGRAQNGGVSVERRGYDSNQQPAHGRHRGLGSIPLSHSFVIDDFEAPLNASFVVVSAHVSFLLQADSVTEKNEWVAALKASMDCCTSSSSLSASNSSCGRPSVRRTTGAERMTVTSSTDVSVGKTNGRGCASSEIGGGGGGGNRRDERQESSSEGVTTASSAGSSLSALTSASASRSSSSSACSSSSSSASSSSLTSSSCDGVTPSASSGGGGAAESRALDGGADGGNDDPIPTPAAAPAGGDGGVATPESSSSRRRPTMQRPLVLGHTTTKTRAPDVLLKGRGKSKLGGRGGAGAGGGAGARAGRGRAESTSTWRKRRGSVVRLVSRRKNTENSSALDLLTVGAGGSINSGNAEHSSGGVGGCGGRSRGSISSTNGGSHQSCSSSGIRSGRCKLQEFSFWVACGSTGEIVRWETLHFDAPTSDDAWNGAVGFRRALANSACVAEFRELLRTRHASENLNFREAVAHYQALCYDNMKKRTPSAHARAGARVVSANASPAVSSSTAPVDGGPLTDGEGDRQGAAQGSGGGASSAATSCASSSSSCFKVDEGAAAAAAAARDIVNRFVKEGAPEQVNLSATTRESIVSQQQKQHGVVETEAESPPSPSVELFAEAWDEVSKLLQRDAFAQFRNSDAFLRLKREWNQEPNGVLAASEFVLAPASSGGSESYGAGRATTFGTSSTRASSGLAMVALHPPQTETPPRPAGTGTSPSGRNGAQQTSSVDKQLESGRSPRKGTPYPSPKPSLSQVRAPPVLPPPSFPVPTTALGARMDEPKSAASLRSCASVGSPGAPPSACSPATSTSSRASIRSRLLSGLADHELQQCQQQKQLDEQTPMTITPSDICTVPRDRMFSIATAVAGSPSHPTPPPSRPLQTPPGLRASEQRLSGARRERAAATKQPKPRKMGPGAKSWESIVSAATVTTKESAEPKSSAGCDDVGDDSAHVYAWPWPVEPPRACSSFDGSAHQHKHQRRQQQQQQQQQHCVMPPLPLGPSLRHLKATTARPIPETLAALEDAAAASPTMATTTGKDVVALGGAQGVTESAKHFIRNMGTAEELCVTIPPPNMRMQTPSPSLHSGDAVGDQSCVSREEQLSVDAVAWAAAAVEREELELREEEEEEEEQENAEERVEKEQEHGEEDSSSMSPPSAPPRLVNRYANTAANATAAAAAGAAASAAASSKNHHEVPTKYSSPRGLVTPVTDDSREARAARAYAAAAEARKARKQAAAAAAAAAMTPLQRRQNTDHERVTTPLGERRRFDARSVRKSPRHNKVQLLLQAPPGTGLGVMLTEHNRTAMVAGFRSLPDDNFDSVLCAGLRVGDVLVSVNGSGVRGNFDLAEELMTRGQEDGELRLVVKRAQESPASRALSQRGERHFCS